MKTLFTSDHHFGHKRIIELCDRPWANVQTMDADLIRIWNNCVGPDDVIYHLGDFTLGGINDFSKYVSQLNGKIKIVPGGHDYRWLKGFDHASPITSKSGHEVEILEPLVSLEFDRGEEHPLVIVLCHYAMRVWDRSHYGSYHLFGHSHGNLPRQGNSFDIGVDVGAFFFNPITLEEVIGRMKLGTENTWTGEKLLN